MRSLTWFACLAFSLPLGWAQTSIPATAPTRIQPNLPAVQPAFGASAPAAAVTWNGSALRVTGNGESLRSVLRQISRATGMKVSGGVPDEPVFASYGPGPVQQVLASLLSGLNVNVMLVNGSPVLPKELVLTARTGGPTPPSAAEPLSAFDDPADVNLAPTQQPIGRHNSPNSFQQIPDTATRNGAGPAVPLNDSGATDGQTTDANGTPQSSNGVRTPEQIFDELRKRQQRNTAPQ